MADRMHCTHTTAPRPTLPDDTALTHLACHLTLWPVAGVLVALDLWSKAWAFRALEPGDAPKHLSGLITFQRSMNSGALFGMGQGLVYVFVLASVVALAFVLYIFVCSSRREHVLHAALALILAGALGNLHDRVFIRVDHVVFKPDAAGDVAPFFGEVVGSYEDDPVRLRPWGSDEEPRSHPRNGIETIQSVGVVRDFIKFQPQVFGRDVWPWVFNLADALLTVGVGVLLVHFWHGHRRHGARQTPPAPAEKDTAR